MGKTDTKTQKTVFDWNVIFINLLLFLVIGVAFWQWKGQDLAPCLLPQVGVALWGIVLLFSFQVIWRYFYPLLERLFLPKSKTTISLPGISISTSLQSPIKFINALKMPSLVLKILFGITLFVSLIALLDFPFLIPAEDAPIVQEFSIHYLPSALVESHHPGDTIKVKDQILVETKTMSACATPCKWSATKGTLLPGKGCSTLYTPSVAGGMDTLTVVIQSPCKTLITVSTLFITP